MTAVQQSLSFPDNEEDSFIILGTSPPISMEQSFTAGQSLSIIEPNPGNQAEASAQETIVNGTATNTEVQGHASIESKTGIAGMSSSIMNHSFGSTFASKYLLGEIDKSTMQASVLQQFPSLNANNLQTDDVVKLYSLLDEHAELKENLEKTNVAMRRQFSVLQQWQEMVKTKLSEKNQEIDELHKAMAAIKAEKHDLEEKVHENEKLVENLKKELNETYESFKTFEESVTKEHQELRMEISEKESIIKNIHADNERLQLEAANFVVLQKNKEDQIQSTTAAEYLLKSEHDKAVKDLTRQMSNLLAQNLEFDDMKKVYKEELDCLKVNLTSAEELHEKMRNTIATLQTSNSETSKRAEETGRELQGAKEEIDLLRAQVEVYRNDFQQEREAREKLATEKEDMLADLKLLQTRNKQLIDDAQERFRTPIAGPNNSQNVTPSAPKPSSSTSNSPEIERDPVRYICPICSSDMKTLRLLEQHIDICLKD